MITLDHVTKTFGSMTAVDSVSMEVPAGSVCVLLGPSGCGKTTTMKMINRLIAPSSGKIIVDGKDNATVNEVRLSSFDRLRHSADRPVSQQDCRGQHHHRPGHAGVGPPQVGANGQPNSSTSSTLIRRSF